MMKKYNKPEIVALALETVDVIETSGDVYAAKVAEQAGIKNVVSIEDDINNMTSEKWHW